MRSINTVHPRAVYVVFAAVFDLVDRDGGGTVTKEELGELVRGCGNKGGRRNEDFQVNFRLPITVSFIRSTYTAAQAEQAVFMPCTIIATWHIYRGITKHSVRF